MWSYYRLNLASDVLVTFSQIKLLYIRNESHPVSEKSLPEEILGFLMATFDYIMFDLFDLKLCMGFSCHF